LARAASSTATHPLRGWAEAIVYQQLNGKAAVTIFNRFADLAGAR